MRAYLLSSGRRTLRRRPLPGLDSCSSALVAVSPVVWERGIHLNQVEAGKGLRGHGRGGVSGPRIGAGTRLHAGAKACARSQLLVLRSLS